MAVFTPLTRGQIAGFLAGYDHGELITFEGIVQGVDNTNYKLVTSTGTYILTLFESRIVPEDIPYFLQLMADFRSNKIPCPAPILSRTHNSIGMIEGKTCALFPFLTGSNVEPSEITSDLCGEVGVWLGRMHNAGSSNRQTLQRANSMGFDAWQSRVEKVGDKAETVYPELRKILRDELAFLKDNWPQMLPQGNIHLDLFPDNVFLENGHVSGIIDFYFAATDFLAYDLAIVMNAWCFDEKGAFHQDRWDHMLSGYSSIRNLQTEEKDSFQHLARGAAVRFLSSRLHDFVFHNPRNLVVPKDPMQYINILLYHKNNKVF